MEADTTADQASMRILLNLVPVKTGGGVQVALAFLDELARNRGWGWRWGILTTRGTPIDTRALELGVGEVLYRVNSGLAARAWFEATGARRVAARWKPHVVFTLMGPPLAGVAAFQVTGTGYSNLFYPEIAFWRNWPLLKRAAYELRDIARTRRTRATDILIVETQQLADRAREQLGWDSDRIRVVRPSVSPLVTADAHHEPTRRRCAGLPKGNNVLLLTGWHFNKGLTTLPAVAAELARAGDHETRFIVTVSASHPYSVRLLADARRRGVEDRFCFFGSVPPEGCVEMYRHTSTTLLLSVLESFSNNMIEAWAMRRPLVITDASWSRASCGDGAIFVDRGSPAAIASALIAVNTDAALRDKVVTAGTGQLKQHPHAQAKAAAYIEIIGDAAERRR